MDACEIDLQVGGTYRYLMVLPDGFEVPFRGEYREISRPDRLVYTEVFDVEPHRHHPALVTMLLTESGGSTTMTTTVLHDSRESRDAHLNSGMESGAAECYKRVDVILSEMIQANSL